MFASITVSKLLFSLDFELVLLIAGSIQADVHCPELPAARLSVANKI